MIGADAGIRHFLRNSFCQASRSTILSAVQGVAVLPARVAVDLNEDDEMDQADLSYPAPRGVLRVLVKSAQQLPAADLTLSGATSDPYGGIEAWDPAGEQPMGSNGR
eukprot:Skav203579  [mRNA]  locus=scaffold935:81650:82320:+ [translate_table: standard]